MESSKNQWFVARCNVIILLRLRVVGDKYEDVPCDSYTYRGRSRSMRHVIPAADLVSGSSVHTTKSSGRDRSRTVRARSFLVAVYSLETGTSIPVSLVGTRATGREPFAIDRKPYAKVSCGHALRDDLIAARMLTKFHYLSWLYVYGNNVILSFMCITSGPEWTYTGQHKQFRAMLRLSPNPFPFR